MIPGRFAAAEGREAPLAEGLGADYAMSEIYELQNVQKERDLTIFYLHA
jgi:hypothetical protein